MKEDAAKAKVNGIKNVASVDGACLENNRNESYCSRPSMYIPLMQDTIKTSISVAGAGVCNPFAIERQEPLPASWITKVWVDWVRN